MNVIGEGEGGTFSCIALERDTLGGTSGGGISVSVQCFEYWMVKFVHKNVIILLFNLVFVIAPTIASNCRKQLIGRNRPEVILR